MFLNKHIEKISIIYYMLSHSISWRTHWENLYHLLSFLILFLDERTEKISIIYYVLFHSTSRFSLKTRMSSTRSYWENLYHLLCTFSFYFSIFFENMHELNLLLLKKSLSFTMCFLTLFLDERTEKTSIIYYVLSHSISWFSLKTRMSSILSYWENLYHLLCAFLFYFSIFFENMHEFNSLLLRKSLSFTMCFLTLFLNKRTEKTSIIYYVLFYSISRFSLKTRMSSTRSYWENLYHLLCAFSSNWASWQAHYHWENLYYLLCAFSSCSSTSALSLKKSLLFDECFLSYQCSRLNINSDHDWC